MIRLLPILLLSLSLAVALAASGQQQPETSSTSSHTLQSDDPVANPGRPTVSTPATLTPVGYIQFETGFLGATHSPAFSSQSNLNEVMKFSLSRRIELL